MADLTSGVATLLHHHQVRGDEAPFAHNGFSDARLTSIGDGAVRHIIKRVSYAGDWIMQATADVDAREAQFAVSTIVSRLPKQIAVPTVGAARDGDRAALLMRDISPYLLPDDRPIDAERVDALLTALAGMHAAFWNDPLANAGVSWCGAADRLTLLSPVMGRRLINDGRDFGLAAGWEAFDRHAPPAAREIARSLFDEPAPLVAELAALPATLVHGDIKFANAGVDLETRVVWLIDWALVSRGPVALEFAWFPAVNTPQLRWPPDELLERYAARLRVALGNDTFAAADWPRQRALAAISSLLLMGWAKALDHDAGRAHELAWVCERAVEGARSLGWR